MCSLQRIFARVVFDFPSDYFWTSQALFIVLKLVLRMFFISYRSKMSETC